MSGVWIAVALAPTMTSLALLPALRVQSARHRGFAMYAGATRKRWFSDEFGFNEFGPKNVVLEAAPDTFFEVLPRERDADGSILKSLANGQQWAIGTFSTPTLSELRRSYQERRSEPAVGQDRRGLRFSAIEADVIDLHADASNLHATFQVASQFNCLEMPSDSYTPAAGITGYVNDRTQGPACALCTAPALVYRNYLHTPDRQLDNLDEMSSALGNDDGRLWTMRNGYTLSKPQRLEELRRAIEGASATVADRERLLGHLKVGVHADIAVTRKDEQGHQGRIEESMVVSHVLGSACAVAYNPGTRADEWEPFARLVLEASYEACVLAALHNRDRHDGMAGSKKLFLTLLGGDAFGNPQAWILDAIRRALIKFQHEDVDVFLVCYDGVDAGPRALEGELAAM
jgi:hypothetical protein